MQIIVQCPRCQSRYQLEASLKGQAVRCPSSSCGQVFRVPDVAPVVQDGKVPPPVRGPGRDLPPAGKQVSGSVGFMVPLFDAEEAAPPGPAPAAAGSVEELVPLEPAEISPPAPRDLPAWQQQPPPVRKNEPPQVKARTPSPKRPEPPSRRQAPPTLKAENRAPAPPEEGGADWRQQAPPPRAPGTPAPLPVVEPIRVPPAKAAPETMRMPLPEPVPADPDAPIELPPGAWEAPPVRKPGAGAFDSSTTAPSPESELEQEIARARHRRRRARLLLVCLALVLAGLAGGAVWFLHSAAEDKELRRFAEAREKYQDRDFGAAAKLFHALEDDFPRSERKETYHFYAALSEARQPAYSPLASAKDVKAVYENFMQFVEENQDNEQLKKARGDVRDTLYALVMQLTNFVKRNPDPATLDLARKVLAKARGFREGEGGAKEDQDAEAALAGAEQELAVRARRQKLFDQLDELARKPSGEAVKKALSLVRFADPALANDGEVQGRVQRVIQAHQKSVQFTPVARAEREEAPEQETAPSIRVTPRVDGLGLKPWTRQRPVLALARGVLYALRPSSGTVLWSTRVGIDTTTPPVRIPAFKSTPELVLVTNSDTQTLSALQARDGKPRWHHRLSAPCLGRPTRVRDHVFVPCYDGRVEEVETATGKLVGYFDVGQSLSLGGVYDEDSQLLYLPADTFCVYVLDLAKKRCAAILYTNHPSGSLHCEPIVIHFRDIPPDAPPDPNAPHSCLVLCQADGLDATELKVYSLPITRSDAAPLPLNLRVRGWSWFPPYQDAEKLGLVTDRGVVGLFGIRQKSNKDPVLFPLLERELVLSRAPGTDPDAALGRAQMVYFDESNFWALADGRLHRLQLTLGPQGPRMTELWTPPLPLGSPLHAAQADPARKLFFLVTQAGPGQTCLASAVAAEAASDDRDKVRWKTQLGLVCQGDPVVDGDSVLVQDQRGNLFRFPVADYPEEKGGAWLSHEKVAAGPSDEIGAEPVAIWPIKGGALALAQAGREGGQKLILRRFDVGQNQVQDYPFMVQSPVAGQVGVWDDHVILPLNNGVLLRKQLGPEPPVSGPNWRAKLADENAPGYVVPLSATDFLMTDGSRGLFRMTWAKNDDNYQNPAKETLPARVVAAPLAVVRPDGTDFKVFVADADNQMSVLQGDLKSDRFDTLARVPLPGRVTAGPFALGPLVGCIVENRTLVLLDGEKNQVVGKYQPAGEAEIVGRPVLAGGLIVVADRDGRLVGLDPATGKARGPGYQLRANVALATTPAPFGADRLFAPLTDGTVLLLPLKELGAAPEKKEP